jgi:transcriptional regulator with XRE-family HTH domain
MDDFPGRLRAALAAQGLTLRGAARALHYDPAYLSRVLNGKQPPSAKLLAAVEELTQETFPAPALSVDDRSRIACGSIDAEVVRALADMLSAQRRLDDALGSAAVLTPTLAQIEAIESLATSASGDAARQLCSVTAEWVRFAGWLHASLRKDRDAVKLFARAEELADEANDSVTAALAISFRGYVARQRGNWPGVIRASIAARQSPGTHCTQRTFDTLQAAQGYAGLAEADGMRRHRDDARRMLGEASEMIEDMTGDNAIPPPSVYWYSPTFFRMNIGMVHFGLGDMADAVENLSVGIAGLPDEHKNTEWAKEYRDALAAARGED